jgi:hypothetical protein
VAPAPCPPGKVGDAAVPDRPAVALAPPLPPVTSPSFAACPSAPLPPLPAAIESATPRCREVCFRATTDDNLKRRADVTGTVA